MKALVRFAELLSEDVAVVFSSISIHDLGFEHQVMLIGLLRWNLVGALTPYLLASPQPAMAIGAMLYPDFLVHVCCEIRGSLEE